MEKKETSLSSAVMFLVLGVTRAQIRRRSEGKLIIDGGAAGSPRQRPGDGGKVRRRLWAAETN